MPILVHLSPRRRVIPVIPTSCETPSAGKRIGKQGHAWEFRKPLNSSRFALKFNRRKAKRTLRSEASNPSAPTIRINNLHRFLAGLNPTNPHTCIFEKFCVGCELAVHHSFPVYIHGCCDVGVSHHLLLNTD